MKFFRTGTLNEFSFTDKPITCPIQDLTKPLTSWDFTPSMSCSDETIDGDRKAARLNMPMGSTCTYRYTCPMDAQNIVQESTMRCERNGKWSGTMPDCTRTADELVS